ncbi:MAG: hypothetical protein B6241_13225 [Spirochaetaceae bacterium 4572_59]|nr:MAG: hypothetical protein B6241_13225 [Spirochaetaceae bacterium 4572_59]
MIKGRIFMGDVLVDQNQLEQIGNYVKSHIGQWLKDQHILTFPEGERSCSDKELLERMITVEQQLKFQNEKLEMMMDQSDKRFDAVDKRIVCPPCAINLSLASSEIYSSRQGSADSGSSINKMESGLRYRLLSNVSKTPIFRFP